MKYSLEESEKYDSLKQLGNLTSQIPSDYSVDFSEKAVTYCVGMVDIVNSTKITHQMTHEKIVQYYQIFLNSIGSVLGRFGGVVIKNMGDSILYYFPESSKHKRKYGFMSCLEANLAIIDEHSEISNKLLEKGLPSLDYRVSTDYGPCLIMKTNNSTVTDMVGPPMNMCSKINRSAAVNGIVIGSDCYEAVKNLDEYEFKRCGDFSIGLKHSYPLYSVFRKRK